MALWPAQARCDQPGTRSPVQMLRFLTPMLLFAVIGSAPSHGEPGPRGRPTGGLLELWFGQSRWAQRVSQIDAGEASLSASPSEPMAETKPQVDPQYLPRTVDYPGPEKTGTIIINTKERLLYLVQPHGTALRYGIGVGRPGFSWSGVKQISRKREWPDWRPPDDMLKRRPDLPHYMPGGLDNPLGARALYLGSSLYRIHGSNEPWTIGTEVSSGCFRMRNEDVIDLFNRVKVGTRVVVL